MATVDAFALKKLQQLETTYPVIKKPSNEVINFDDSNNGTSK